MKIFLVSFFLAMIIWQLPSQVVNDIPQENKRHYIVNVDLLSVNFRYEKEFKKDLFFGAGFGYGLGTRVSLVYFKEQSDFGLYFLFENIKIQFCLSKQKGKSLYQTGDVFFSFYTPGEGWLFPYGGVEYNIFYGYRHLKIGTGIQAGIMKEKYEMDKAVKFRYFLVPVILHFNI